MMRVVFFGTPAFGVPTLGALLETGEEVVAAVSQPDKPSGRGRRLHPTPVKEFAASKGVAVLQPAKIRTTGFLEEFRALAPDMAVVAAYGKILPRELLEVPTRGFVNVHASLLPAYRGACPIEWAVIRGERTTGISIMKVTEGLDEGPVFAREEVAIGEDESAGELAGRLAEAGARLLVRVLPAIRDGSASPAEQDHGAATLAPKLSKEDGRISWAEPAGELRNRVRGMHPWPGAFAWLRGVRVLVHRTRVAAGSDLAAASASGKNPGEVVSIEPDGPAVATGEGALVLIEVQPASRRRVCGAEFARGLRLKLGERFE